MEKAEVLHKNIPCVQFIWKENFEYQINGKLKNFTSKEIALKHYYFAKNLYYWDFFKNNIIYENIKIAYKNFPENKDIEKLFLISNDTLAKSPFLTFFAVVTY